MADDVACAEAGDDLRTLDWQTAAARAEAMGSPLQNLPSGLRVRKPGKQKSGANHRDDEEEEPSMASILMPSRTEVVSFLAFAAACVLILNHVIMRRQKDALTEAMEAAHPASCKQCQPGWWEEFWRWRLEGIAKQESGQGVSQTAPHGMEWEWAENGTDTDWYGVSAEFVDKVVSNYADPELGPILHVGCGDSPMPGLLYKAGFVQAEHIDIAPQIVSTLKERYAADAFPGMTFAVRDFLAPAEAGGGPPPPLNRFAAVIDKAGIWDWLQDEALEHVPLLLSMVRDALLLGPQKGVYIIVTKQNPSQFSDSLAHVRAQFSVETTQRLGAKNIAWSYVLEPL